MFTATKSANPESTNPTEDTILWPTYHNVTLLLRKLLLWQKPEMLSISITLVTALEVRLAVKDPISPQEIWHWSCSIKGKRTT